MTPEAPRAGRARDRRSALIAGAVVLCLTGSLPRARAGGVDSFDQEVADAQRLYQAHDYEGAIARLQQAYQQKPIARLLFNMAMAHRKAGHAREAIDLFQRFRAARGAADRDVPVDRYIDEMRQQLAAPAPTPAPHDVALTAPPPRAPDPEADLTLMPVGQAEEGEPPRPGLLHRWWFWTAAGVVVAAAVGAVLLANRSSGHCTSDVQMCQPYP
jgi:hypothetical protein